MLDYQGVKHAAGGKLAVNLTIKSGSEFSTAVRFPQASALEVRQTRDCWVFLERARAIGGNAEVELYVNDAKVSHFTVAVGENDAQVQSLAEQVTSRITDTTVMYNITLKNISGHDVLIRELRLQWLAS